MLVLLLPLMWAVATEAKRCPQVPRSADGACSTAVRVAGRHVSPYAVALRVKVGAAPDRAHFQHPQNFGPEVFALPASHAQEPPAGNVPTRFWKVEYQESGGIGGIKRRVTLASDGHVVREDVKRKTRVLSQVPAQQLAEVNAILNRLRKPGIPRPGPQPTFPDAMFFTLTITLDGKEYPADPTDRRLARLHALMVSILSADHNEVQK